MTCLLRKGHTGARKEYERETTVRSDRVRQKWPIVEALHGGWTAIGDGWPLTLAPEREQSSNTEQPKPANAAHWQLGTAKGALLAPILNPGKARRT